MQFYQSVKTETGTFGLVQQAGGCQSMKGNPSLPDELGLCIIRKKKVYQIMWFIVYLKIKTGTCGLALREGVFPG